MKLIYTTSVVYSADSNTVRTYDKEYGEIVWRIVDGAKLQSSQPDIGDRQWEDFEWHEMPPGGDAATSLEQETAAAALAVLLLFA